MEDGRAGTTGLFGDASPVLSHALTQMDQWLTGIGADISNASAVDKLRRNKPSDLVDACFTDNGTVKIAEEQVYQGPTTCNQLYPAFSTPRMVAGESVANNVLKCRLKSIQTDDYHVSFTSAQRARLKAIFPQGVCDFTKPGVGQVPTEGTFQSF